MVEEYSGFYCFHYIIIYFDIFMNTYFLLGGGHCNFMHLKYISRSFKNFLFKEMHEKNPEYKEKEKKRRERRRKRKRSRSRDRYDNRSRRYGRRSRSRSISPEVRKMMNSVERRKQIEKWKI